MSEIVMPRLSDTMEEGTILRWLKQDGEQVARGEELVEIETDKASMVYESDQAGTLTLIAAEGDTLAVGEPIARVGDAEPGAPAASDAQASAGEEDEDEGVREATGSGVGRAEGASEQARAGDPGQREDDLAAPDSGERVKASPLARRMASEGHIDLHDLTGSGPGGRIVKADVLAGAERDASGEGRSEATNDQAEGQGTRAPSAQGEGKRGQPTPAPGQPGHDQPSQGESSQESNQGLPTPGQPAQGEGMHERSAQGQQTLAQPAPEQPIQGQASPGQQDRGQGTHERQAQGQPTQAQPTQGQPIPEGAPAASAAEVATAKGMTTDVELTRTQQAVARRMAESKATIPDFSLLVDVDMEQAVALREQLKGIARDDAQEPIPTYNDMVVKASALALREFPKANGSYRSGRVQLHSRVNVGVAVAAEDSLVVPTVFDAGEKSLGEIARETRALAARVRDGSITPPELGGGTFTVSNLGMLGIRRFTAIVNPPQAAILSVGSLEQRAVVRDDEVVARQTMSLTLACDHRILYGAEAARFLARVRELLESPAALTL